MSTRRKPNPKPRPNEREEEWREWATAMESTWWGDRVLDWFAEHPLAAVLLAVFLCCSVIVAAVWAVVSGA